MPASLPLVRRATAADAPALARMRWDWRVDHGEVPDVDAATYERDLAAWCAAHQDSHLGFVVELDGTVVGMAWLAIVERVPGPGSWLRLSGYLQSVYVEPEHRNVGVGAVLVGALIDEARARGLDYLAVHPSEASMDLYGRLGFAPYGRALELRFT